MSQMSFQGFTQSKDRPVKIGMVFQYSLSYHRAGRFWVRKEPRPDFWETTELTSGADRNYSTDDILNYATPTGIQPGQLYHDGEGKLCKIVRPVFAWESWKVERDGKEIDYDIREYSINGWKRVADGAQRKKPADVCPLCGAAGLAMAVLFDCSSSSCRNYNNRRGNP